MKGFHNRGFDANYIYIILLAGLFFIPFLGKVHLFDWDEINFAESAREMIVTGDYLTVQVNFIPFWEKPPLFIWMQVLSMKIFGINEFAARLPNAICGIVTLLLLYYAGKKLLNKKFGLLWALTYGGSILPFFYFKSGIIDPWFNLFIFSGVWCFYKYISSNERSKKLLYAIFSGSFIGLGILTKGPVALLIFAITAIIFLFFLRKLKDVFFKDVVVFGVFMSVTGGMWFILQIMIGNFGIIADFIEYQIRLFKTQDAGHGGFLLYHFVVVFFGVFPASVIALGAIRKNQDVYFKGQFKELQVLMFIMLSVVLILFTIVKTKIMHYSSASYFPLTFFSALVIYQLDRQGLTLNKFARITISFLGILYGSLVFLLPWLVKLFRETVLERDLISDPFAAGNLEANVEWTGFEGISGLILIAGVIFFIKYRTNLLKSVVSIYISTVLFISLALVLIIPGVEGYSQRAAIEFYKSKAGKDVYIQTLGFKSYAHFFYAQKRIPENPLSYENEWLLYGDIDKDAYFVTKIQRKQRVMETHPHLELLYVKNGFVFFKRPKVSVEDDQ